MLITTAHLAGIKAGTIRCAFRCWRRPTVKPGGSLKTAVGVLAIDGVTTTRRSELSAADARRAGYGSLAELLAQLRGRAGTLHRIDLRYLGADPRIALRGSARLSRAELDSELERLRRMDARSRTGPWTRRVLALLHDKPGVRAGDLARSLGRETLAFKRDVRKLVQLGLTESLATGYRLSPRGATLLRALTRR